MPATDRTNGQMNFGEAVRSLWHYSLGSVSLTIVWVCVALFVGVTALDVLGLVARRELVSVLGLSYAGLVQRKFLFEPLTAPLVHANIAHLLFNMLSLWMLGPEVENRLGRARYILFSVLCAAAGMAGFLVCKWHSAQVVVGYSGVIFGILVAQAMFFPNNIIAIFAFFPIKMKYAVLLLGAAELYLTISPEGGGVAHAAHLAGAVVAFLYLRITSWADVRSIPRANPSRPAIRPKPTARIHDNIPREL